MIGIIGTGPQPWRFNSKVITFDYNFYGNLVKIKNSRDSFIYNNKNQLVTKLRKIFSDTSQFFVVNRFSYDAKGNLVADSGYVLQSYAKPDGVLYGYDQYTYDDRGNVIRDDRFEVWPTGTVRQTTYTASYDTKKNPYKSFGLLPYLLFYDHGFFFSANNKMEPGYNMNTLRMACLKNILPGLCAGIFL
jgi:hypothetical protein